MSVICYRMTAKQISSEAIPKIAIEVHIYLDGDEVAPSTTLLDYVKKKQVHRCSKCGRTGHKRPTCTYQRRGSA